MEIITGIGLFLSIAGGVCAIVLPLILTVALGVFLYRRYQQSSAAKQSAQAWPSTTGTVLASSVQVKRTGRSRSEIPVVVYQYEANGKTYQSQRVKAGDKFMSVRIMGEAQATMARYPIGSRVTVYYDPANPAESALER